MFGTLILGVISGTDLGVILGMISGMILGVFLGTMPCILNKSIALVVM